MDHYNSSSSSLKTTTDNSTSRFNFRNENYNGGNYWQTTVGFVASVTCGLAVKGKKVKR